MMTAASAAGWSDPTAAAQGSLIGQAGALAGVVHAAAAESHTAHITVREFEDVTNQAVAAMTAACNTVGDIPVPEDVRPYVESGVLLTPEQADDRSGNDGLGNYYAALWSMAFVRKFELRQFSERYDVAAGVDDPSRR